MLFEAYNGLGYGYQEKYYQRAVAAGFSEKKISYKCQAPFQIVFNGKQIGKYYLDFVVENKIVLELKKGNFYSKKI